MRVGGLEPPDGWQVCVQCDPFELFVGPMLIRERPGEPPRFAFVADRRHGNASGIVHGGMLMTFADFAMCLAAHWDRLEENVVTVSLDCHFVAACEVGDLVEAECEVTRQTGSMVFMRARLVAGERTLMTASAVIKRLR
ncbi:MAG TPA: PaaI family thioesterase [Thermoanaerobaculia bacterium]|nr:PaaI family thioesterase [Thermoanaerobaculia bacterium]